VNPENGSHPCDESMYTKETDAPLVVTIILLVLEFILFPFGNIVRLFVVNVQA
jgi:hypothetical protein